MSDNFISWSYVLISMLNVDDPYTLDQLKDPQMNALIVRPLVDRLYDPEDICIGECYQLRKF